MTHENRKIITVVQVRMGSTRLSGKVLKEIVGRPMLWHIINRLKHARLVDEIIIATSDNAGDRPIIEFAKANGVGYYAGSELDLLDRWYRAVKKFKPDAMVWITGDCPLVDPGIVDKVIKYYLEKGPFECVTNTKPKATYPHGLDVGIYSFKALERAWKDVRDPFWREWASAIFFEHPEKYRLGNVVNDEDLSQMRWTVDYPEDLDFVTEVYKRLYREDRVFLMEDILELLKKHPELMKINEVHVGKDGYREVLRGRGKL